jgi:hypothetical protein
MSSTDVWWWFWTVSFVLAALAFAAISAVVAVRGLADLKGLIRTLKDRRPSSRSS